MMTHINLVVVSYFQYLLYNLSQILRAVVRRNFKAGFKGCLLYTSRARLRNCVPQTLHLHITIMLLNLSVWMVA